MMILAFKEKRRVAAEEEREIQRLQRQVQEWIHFRDEEQHRMKEQIVKMERGMEEESERFAFVRGDSMCFVAVHAVLVFACVFSCVCLFVFVCLLVCFCVFACLFLCVCMEV